MEGEEGEEKGGQQESLARVSASNAVSSPTAPPFHEMSTNSPGFYECPAPSTMLVE